MEITLWKIFSPSSDFYAIWCVSLAPPMLFFHKIVHKYSLNIWLCKVTLTPVLFWRKTKMSEVFLMFVPQIVFLLSTDQDRGEHFSKGKNLTINLLHVCVFDMKYLMWENKSLTQHWHKRITRTRALKVRAAEQNTHRKQQKWHLAAKAIWSYRVCDTRRASLSPLSFFRSELGERVDI